ncbi:copper amine oxidase [Myceligenerans crystallogenes]|uniref:Amine oxidase n=1 Tax=Myceligenerans crystallogenes TaxID=316335 RepID=A0ABN2N7K3_9MICO
MPDQEMGRRRRSWPGWIRRVAVIPGGLPVVAVVAVVVLVSVVWTAGPTTGGEQEGAGAPAASSDTVREPGCGAGEPLTETLSSGSAWTMCWRIDPDTGLVLEDVTFVPAGHEQVRVLASLTIGQLEVPYDSGVRSTEDITAEGFGGRSMLALGQESCRGERLSAPIPTLGDGETGTVGTREVLCRETVDGGIAYHAKDERADAVPLVERRTDLRLSTISKVGWYEYVTQYTFGADGSITPELGATGDLSPADYSDRSHGWAVGEGEHDHATSHSHNVVWKVHWALGGRGGQVVEQYDAEDTPEMGPRSRVVAGRLLPIPREDTRDRENRRWWRVVNPALLNDDGHPVSYEIGLGATSSFTFTHDDDHEHGGYDIAFTEAEGCQEFATANRDAHCGRGVPDYVEDRERLDDVVSWVAVGFHHVPRDEDQSPMESHWQGFTMVPRDVTATRPDVPPEREGINGSPPPAG